MGGDKPRDGGPLQETARLVVLPQQGLHALPQGRVAPADPVEIRGAVLRGQFQRDLEHVTFGHGLFLQTP